MSGAAPATGIAGILVAPSSRARPSRAVPPGSVAELSCQKIIFDLQLADLPVQKIDLRFIGGSLHRRTALEDAHRTIQQLLLPVVDLVRVHPEMHRQLGDGTVAPDCRHRHLRLERRAVLLPCPLHVLLPRYPRFLGAGLYLSHLSHFRGPAHLAPYCRSQQPDPTSRLLRGPDMTQIYIISGTSWMVPADWSNSNTIETVGGGGGGYSKISNISGLSGTLTIQVGAGGALGVSGGDTWFNGPTLGASSVGAKGGGAGDVNGHGGTGGAAVSGVAPGGTKFSGGNGGAVPFEPWTGAGGGGAAGPNGDGAAGGGGRAVTDGGGGGGGNGGGSAGGSPSGGSNDGGAGGNGGGGGDAGSGA